MERKKAKKRTEEIILACAVFAEEEMHAPNKKLNKTINRLFNFSKRKKT